MDLLDGITTLLFDFDNTLVLLDETDFVKTYGVKLAKRFEDVFDSTQEFLKHLMQGSLYMVTKEGPENNVMKFFSYFSKYCPGLDYKEVYNRFYEFYGEDFSVIRQISKPHPIVEKLFALVSNHYEIVIATNPLFPEHAMLNRLEWINLSKYCHNKTISLVTNAELFTTAKPQLAYYNEILNHIKKKPEECLMVGNDFYNDGAASLIGMKFFHVTEDGQTHSSAGDLLSEQTKDKIDYSKIKIDDFGSLNKFYTLVKKSKQSISQE